MKRLLIVILSLISVTSFAQVRIGGYVTTIGNQDVYPTHIDSLGKGGYREVQTTAGLDSIPILRRTYGMQVRVNQTGINYFLGPDLITWLVPKLTVDGALSPTHSLTIPNGGNGIAFYSNGGLPNYKRGLIGMYNDTLEIMSQFGGSAVPANSVKIAASTNANQAHADRSARVLSIKNGMPNFLFTSYTEQNGDIVAIRPQLNSTNGRQAALNVTANTKQIGTATGEVLRVGLQHDTTIQRPTNLIYAHTDGVERFSVSDVGGIKAPNIPSGTSTSLLGLDASGNFVKTTGGGADTAAINAAIRVKADTTSNLKKWIGNKLNTKFLSSTVSKYTDVTPQSSVNWQNGYVELSGGNNTAGNYIYYNDYPNNSMIKTSIIEFVPTVAGNGIGVGDWGENNTHMGRIILTGVDNGKLAITTGTNTRVTSTNALSYTSTDTVVLRFSANITQYTLQAWTKANPQNGIMLNWVNDKILGTTFSNVRAGRPAIYNYGGTQRVYSHKMEIYDVSQSDIVLWGDSKTAGSYGGSGEGMWSNRFKHSSTQEVTIIAGSSNRTSDYLLVKPTIWAMKPRILLTALGINDIANGLTVQSAKDNITTIIKDCYNNGAIPVFMTVDPVSSTYSSGAATHSQVVAGTTAFNTWLTDTVSKQAIIINSFTALANGSGDMDARYDSGDGIHENELGHSVKYAVTAEALKNLVVLNRNQAYQNSLYVQDERNNFQGTGAGMVRRLSAGTGQLSFNVYSDTYTANPNRAAKGAIFSTGTSNLVLGTTVAGTELEYVVGGGNFGTNKIGGERVDSTYRYTPKYTQQYNYNGSTNVDVYNSNTGTSASANIRALTDIGRGGIFGFGSGRGVPAGRTGFMTYGGAGTIVGGVGDTWLLAGGTNPSTNRVARIQADSIITGIPIKVFGNIIADRANGVAMGLEFNRNNKKRWSTYATATSETGSNGGTNLAIERFADDGITSLGLLLSANRATGLMTIPQTPSFTNTSTGTAGTDSIVVKDDATNTFRRIPANYYQVAGTGGSVSNFSFTNANGFTGVVTNSTTTPNLTLTLQDASISQSGQVNTGSQSFNGAKNFNGQLQATSFSIGTIPTSVSSNTYDILSRNAGTGVVEKKTEATFNVITSGNGSATTITIAHGVSGVSNSSKIFITPRLVAAGGYSFVTMDATNIYINYAVAPVSGTNNLSYDIQIQP